MVPDAWAAAIRNWAQFHTEIEEVWLYGSYARGDATSKSDLDLAVVPNGDSDARLLTYICEAGEWEKELQAALPVRVHLELGDREQCDSIVGPALEREGVRIFSST
jgi:predicted nucleotidyltransferase